MFHEGQGIPLALVSVLYRYYHAAHHAHKSWIGRRWFNFVVFRGIMNFSLHYFHKAGWPFMAIAAAVLLASWLVGGWGFWPLLILTVWVFYFFRNPDRATPVGDGLVISPADGRVVAVREVVPDADLELGDAPRVRISVFLNVFNVHVNRLPVNGVIQKCLYRPGKFVNASLDKASVDNERMALVVQMTGNHPYDTQTLGVVQIAGLIARRIVCDAREGDVVRAGQRYGIIRFGSRADIYLPQGMQSLVSVGQTMIGGETILARAVGEQHAQKAEVVA